MRGGGWAEKFGHKFKIFLAYINIKLFIMKIDKIKTDP